MMCLTGLWRTLQAVSSMPHRLLTKPVCQCDVAMGVVPMPAPVPRKRTHIPQPAPSSH